MESHPLRGFLSRWARVRAQARLAPSALWGLVSLPLALSCAGSETARPVPSHLPRVPPDEIVVKTASFAFHAGKNVSETWPANAEETRVALGESLATLLEEEDSSVPILARQLGVTWPREPVDFDVRWRASNDGRPCEAKVDRLVEVPSVTPRLFFACVLARSFERLQGESRLFAGLAGVSKTAPADYACVVAFAVSTLMVAREEDSRTRAALEGELPERCTTEQLDWVGREWITRVREERTAEAFGASFKRVE